MSEHHPFPHSLLPSGRKAGLTLLILLFSLLAHLFVIQWARDSLALVSLLDDEDLIQVSLQTLTATPAAPAIPQLPPPVTRAPEKSPPQLPEAPVSSPLPTEIATAAPVVAKPDPAPAPANSDRTPMPADSATESTAANTEVPSPAPPPASAPSPTHTSPLHSDGSDSAALPTSPPSPSPAPAPAPAPAPVPKAAPAPPPAANSDAPPLFSRISLPPSADLSYDAVAIKGSSKVEGRGLVKWVQNGRQYSITGEASVLFFSVLSYRSEGLLGDLGLLPELYTEKRLGKSSTNTHFHRERQTISFSASTNNYPVKGGEQDRGSVFWQLAGLARGNPDKLQAGLSFELVIAGSRTADPWRVTVHGTESVELTKGKVDAWHMSLIRPDGGTDYQLEVWVAPGQDWYPVKIMYVDRKGTTLGLSLAKLEKK